MEVSFEKVQETGVDYVTATTTTTKGSEFYHRKASEWISDEVGKGFDCHEWSGHGYIGLGAGSFQFGTDGHSCLVRVSGYQASSVARSIIEHSTNVSRQIGRASCRERV